MGFTSADDLDDLDDWDDETGTWGSLDTALGRLAGRVSGVGGKLMLELEIQHEQAEFDHLLSQFLKYGKLVIHAARIRRRVVSLDPLFLFASNSSTSFPHDRASEMHRDTAAGGRKLPPGLGYLRIPTYTSVCALCVGSQPGIIPSVTFSPNDLFVSKCNVSPCVG